MAVLYANWCILDNALCIQNLDLSGVYYAYIHVCKCSIYSSIHAAVKATS